MKYINPQYFKIFKITFYKQRDFIDQYSKKTADSHEPAASIIIYE